MVPAMVPARGLFGPGGDGPPILLLQELPGIGPETPALAARLTAAGFRVYLPHVLGRFGKVTMARNALRLFCVRREINMFLRGAQIPIAAWMRALARHIRDRDGGSGVGVIGMCLQFHQPAYDRMEAYFRERIALTAG